MKVLKMWAMLLMSMVILTFLLSFDSPTIKGLGVFWAIFIFSLIGIYNKKERFK